MYILDPNPVNLSRNFILEEEFPLPYYTNKRKMICASQPGPGFLMVEVYDMSLFLHLRLVLVGIISKQS